MPSRGRCFWDFFDNFGTLSIWYIKGQNVQHTVRAYIKGQNVQHTVRAYIKGQDVQHMVLGALQKAVLCLGAFLSSLVLTGRRGEIVCFVVDRPLVRVSRLTVPGY